MTDKRYQVFISATYLDLREEREALLQVLPTLGCLPIVVEAHGQNLTTMVNIRRRIDESDYFVLLVGSRYGSLMPSGVSYTHMEYVYAATKKKPTVILMHDSPEIRSAELQEQNISGKLKLSDFRKLLIREQPDNIFYWRDKTDLTAALRSMIPALIRCHPSLGWVRVSNSVGSIELEKQCDALKKRIQELEQEREKWLASTAINTENLSKGEDLLEVSYRCKAYAGGNCQDVNIKTSLSWNDLLVSFGSHLLQPQTEDFMAAKMGERLQRNALQEVQREYPKTHAVVEVQMTPICFNTVKMQFRTLGFIQKASRENDTRMCWQLTALGERNLSNVMSVKRGISRPMS